MAHDDVTCTLMAAKILKKIHGVTTRILLVEDKLTWAILMQRPRNAEKFDHLFLHIFRFTNIFAYGYGFDAVTVTKFFEIFHIPLLIRYGKIEAKSLHGIVEMLLLRNLLHKRLNTF